jgi:hypothetical protein
MCKLITGLLTKKCQLNSGRDKHYVAYIEALHNLAGEKKIKTSPKIMFLLEINYF